MTNINDPHFDEPRDHPGFECRRARVGRQLGTERLGVSVWEVPPGQAAYPYHWHVAEEELIVVLAGRPSLRTPEGWTELEEGEVISFRVGEGGAHQLVNRSDGLVRFLAFSNQQADIVVYPDSNKVGAFERRPEGGGIYTVFRKEDGVDYYEGEEPPLEQRADDQPDEAAAVVRRAYEYWGRGDFKSAAKLFHPDIVYVRHASAAAGDAAGAGGRWHGLEQTAIATRDWLAAWEEFVIHEEELEEMGGRVLALTRWSGRGRDSGVPIDRAGADLWTVREGKVVELEMWYDRADALAKLGVSR